MVFRLLLSGTDHLRFILASFYLWQQKKSTADGK